MNVLHYSENTFFDSGEIAFREWAIEMPEERLGELQAQLPAPSIGLNFRKPEAGEKLCIYYRKGRDGTETFRAGIEALMQDGTYRQVYDQEIPTSHANGIQLKDEVRTFCEEEEKTATIVQNAEKSTHSQKEALLKRLGEMANEQQEIERMEEQDKKSEFDEELLKFNNGELSEAHVFNLGKPGEILKNCGFPPNDRIELAASRLRLKASQGNHPFEIMDIAGLDKALQNPVAVFEYGNGSKSQNVIVNLEKDGKNFLVGVFFNQRQRGYEVSDIRGLFNRDNMDWMRWIQQGKMIYGDKEKIQVLSAQQRTNLAEVNSKEARTSSDSYYLDSVDSILQKFGDVKDIYTKDFPEYAEQKEKFEIFKQFRNAYQETDSINAYDAVRDADEFYNAIKNNDKSVLEKFTNGIDKPEIAGAASVLLNAQTPQVGAVIASYNILPQSQEKSISQGRSEGIEREEKYFKAVNKQTGKVSGYGIDPSLEVWQTHWDLKVVDCTEIDKKEYDALLALTNNNVHENSKAPELKSTIGEIGFPDGEIRQYDNQEHFLKDLDAALADNTFDTSYRVYADNEALKEKARDIRLNYYDPMEAAERSQDGIVSFESVGLEGEHPLTAGNDLDRRLLHELSNDRIDVIEARNILDGMKRNGMELRYDSVPDAFVVNGWEDEFGEKIDNYVASIADLGHIAKREEVTDRKGFWDIQNEIEELKAVHPTLVENLRNQNPVEQRVNTERLARAAEVDWSDPMEAAEAVHNGVDNDYTDPIEALEEAYNTPENPPTEEDIEAEKILHDKYIQDELDKAVEDLQANGGLSDAAIEAEIAAQEEAEAYEEDSYHDEEEEPVLTFNDTNGNPHYPQEIISVLENFQKVETSKWNLPAEEKTAVFHLMQLTETDKNDFENSLAKLKEYMNAEEFNREEENYAKIFTPILLTSLGQDYDKETHAFSSEKFSYKFSTDDLKKEMPVIRGEIKSIIGNDFSGQNFKLTKDFQDELIEKGLVKPEEKFVLINEVEAVAKGTKIKPNQPYVSLTIPVDNNGKTEFVQTKYYHVSALEEPQKLEKFVGETSKEKEDKDVIIYGKTKVPEFATITQHGLENFKDMIIDSYEESSKSYLLKSEDGKKNVRVTENTLKVLTSDEYAKKSEGYTQDTKTAEKMIDSQYNDFFQLRDNCANNFRHNLAVFCRKEANSPLDALKVANSLISQMSKGEKQKTKELLNLLRKDGQTVNEVLIETYHEAVKETPLNEDYIKHNRYEKMIARPMYDVLSTEGEKIDRDFNLRIGDSVDITFKVDKNHGSKFSLRKESIYQNCKIISASKEGNIVTLMDGNKSFYDVPRDTFLKEYAQKQKNEHKMEKKVHRQHSMQIEIGR
ncbi:MAG: hypothetical protein IJ688_14645 [Treponema sp.]|nr:hypothetical protein [Treponema sp.]